MIDGCPVAEARVHLPGYFGQHAAGLERYAGHGYERLAVLLEPHHGRSAQAVLYHTARRRHQSLAPCEFVHRQAAFGENAVYVGGHIVVVDQCAAEYVSHHGFGDVVACRAEAACGDGERAFGHRVGYGTAYVGGVVSHGAHGGHGPALLAECAGYQPRIGVGDASEQDFVTDYDYRQFHISTRA